MSNDLEAVWLTQQFNTTGYICLTFLERCPISLRRISYRTYSTSGCEASASLLQQFPVPLLTGVESLLPWVLWVYRRCLDLLLLHRHLPSYGHVSLIPRFLVFYTPLLSSLRPFPSLPTCSPSSSFMRSRQQFFDCTSALRVLAGGHCAKADMVHFLVS